MCQSLRDNTLKVIISVIMALTCLMVQHIVSGLYVYIHSVCIHLLFHLMFTLPLCSFFEEYPRLLLLR